MWGHYEEQDRAPAPVGLTALSTLPEQTMVLAIHVLAAGKQRQPALTCKPNFNFLAEKKLIRIIRVLQPLLTGEQLPNGLCVVGRVSCTWCQIKKQAAL